MSLQWRREIAAFLAPTGTLAARRALGISRGFSAQVSVPAEQGAADEIEAAVATLRPALDAIGDSVRCVRVVLSDVWVRFAVVPAPEVRVDRLGRDALARYALGDVYGETIVDWSVTAADGPPGQPFLACAIPARLVEAVRDAVAADRRMLLSLQPQSVLAYNAARTQLREPGTWFASLGVRSLQAFRCGPHGIDDQYAAHHHASWASELERLAARAAWRGGDDGAPPRIVVDMPPDMRRLAKPGRLSAFDWVEEQGDPSADVELNHLARLYA